jgi:hypothetical protein
MISSEKTALIEDLAARGLQVTGKQIDRWRLERVIPAPSIVGGGRARGVRRITAPGSADQIVALVRLLTESRSINVAAVSLWLDGFDVPVDRVREALHTFAPDPSAIDGAAMKQKAWDRAETVKRQKSAPERLKELARDDQLHGLFEMLTALAIGEAPDVKAVGETFEKATGLDRARSESVAGVGPWSTSDVGENMLIAKGFAKKLKPMIDAGTDDQLFAAREAYRNVQKIVAFAEFAQKIYGPNAFGFASLTNAPLGPQRSRNTMTFLGILFLTIIDSAALKTFALLGATADQSLRAMQKTLAALATSPQQDLGA